MAPLAVRHEVKAPLFAPEHQPIKYPLKHLLAKVLRRTFQRKIRVAPGRAESWEKQIAQLSRFLFYLFLSPQTINEKLKDR